MAQAANGTQLSQLQQSAGPPSLAILRLLKPSTSTDPRTQCLLVPTECLCQSMETVQHRIQQDRKNSPYSIHPTAGKGDRISRCILPGGWQHVIAMPAEHRGRKAIDHRLQSSTRFGPQFAASHQQKTGQELQLNLQLSDLQQQLVVVQNKL